LAQSFYWLAKLRLEHEFSEYDQQGSSTMTKDGKFEAEEQKLVEASFKAVVEADIHQDNKANRIVSAMAFLTAAIATTFTRIYDFTKFPIDLTLIFFSFFLLCVILGTASYLNALGPSFNIPQGLRKKSEDGKIKSLLFFDVIARAEPNAWLDHWKQGSDVLIDEITTNYIFETQLIAQKIKTKVTHMQFGALLYRVALSTILPYLSTIYAKSVGNLTAFYIGSFSLGISALLFILGYEALRPYQYHYDQSKNYVRNSKPEAIGFLTLSALLLVVAMIAFLASRKVS
jgi:hypothetical protein